LQGDFNKKNMEILDAIETDTVILPKRSKFLTRERVVKKDPFAEVFGMWADRDIDATMLRKQAWGIEI
jgi:hypothetical protein